MTKKEITLANQIISNFLGVETESETRRGKKVYLIPFKGQGELCYDEDQLLYHENWTWLMEAVDAIEKLKFHPKWTVEYRVIIKRNYCQIDFGESTIGLEGSVTHVAGTKILAVHGAVVKFIEWYTDKLGDSFVL